MYNKNKLVCIANAPVVPIINKTQFENFQVKIEDKRKKQDQIVEILYKISNAIDLSKKQIKQYDDLIKSRFVEMFGDPVSNPKSWNM